MVLLPSPFIFAALLFTPVLAAQMSWIRAGRDLDARLPISAGTISEKREFIKFREGVKPRLI